jgi:UDPglucose 6-dehydrogenase
LYWSRICWRAYNGSYSTKCPHIQVTVVDLNVERIAAWNDEDLDIPIYEPGLIKLLGSKRKKLILFYGCGKAIDEAQVIFISVNTPTKTYGKEKGWQPI